MENTTPPPQRLEDLPLNSGDRLVATRTGRSHALNATARMALLLLQEDHSVPEVAAILARRWGQHQAVDAGRETFAGQLRRHTR